MASTFSAMSRNRWAGFLEGIYTSAQDILPQQRLQSPAIHHVSGPTQQLTDIDLQSGVFKDANGAVRIEVDQHVDITVRSCFSAGHGSEHGGVLDAKPAQVRLVRLQSSENSLKVRAHTPSKVYQRPFDGEIYLARRVPVAVRSRQVRRAADLPPRPRMGYVGGMTVEAIKEAIADLSDEQKLALAAWLNEQTMDEWDRQMQRDFSAGGRGYHLVDKVKADVRAGKFRPMPAARPRSTG